MKLNKKIIALLLTLSIVFSVVMPISLTSGAATSTSDVILEWDFSDVTGNTVNDISGNNNNGTIDGATVSNGVATFTGGQSEYVRLPANLFDNCSTSDTITIELVINPVVTANWTTFLHFGTSDENYVALAIMGDNNLRFATKTNGDQREVNSSSNPLKLNEDNVVKYKFTPTKTIIYVNDIYVTAVSTATHHFLGNFDNVVASLGGIAFWGADPCFNGTVSHLKISVSDSVSAPDIDRSVKPTLEATTDEILGYVNFANEQSTWTNFKEIASDVTVSGGVATFTGTKSDDVNAVVNSVVFNSALFASIKDTLIIEMTIKPTTISEHRVIMSIGDREDFYAVMGMRNTNALKFNEGKSSNNIIAPNEWITLKYIMNESGSYIYVNNVLYAKTTPISLKRLMSSDEPIKFGQRTVSSWNDDSFVGDVSEIRITTSKAGALNFSLQAVNLLTGEDPLTNSSKLTIQYTDATIGTESDPVKLYAKITDTTTNTVLYSQQIDTLAIQTRDVYATNGESTEGTASNVDIYSDAVGSISFTPGSAVNGKNISNLEVTIWTENSAGLSSNPATTTINNNFGTPTDGTPSGTNWMNYIDGATLLSQINIPGTHDSTTYNIGNESYNKCQSVDVSTQLGYGVRYLDLRAQMDGNVTTNTAGTIIDFGFSHSNETCKDSNGNNLMFSSVIADCKSFLKDHPSECIIIAINDEDLGDYKRADLANALHYFVSQTPELFYTQNNEVPTLDDVRGKMVVLRRYPVNHGGENGFMDFFWKDNCSSLEHGIFSQLGTFDNGKRSSAITTYTVQDYYGNSDTNGNWYGVSTMSTSTKQSTITAFINNVAKVPNQYYINFFSMAYTTSSTVTFHVSKSPQTLSGTINSWFNNTLSSTLKPGIQYGYMLFDFITAGICQKVYQTNIFTTTPQVDASGKSINGDKVVVHYNFANVENNLVEDMAGNGFSGSMLNADALEFNSIYDMITFNNADAAYGSISVPQGAFSGTGDTATLQVWVKSTVNMDSVLFGTGCDNPNNSFTGTTDGFAFKTTKVGSATKTFGSSNASGLTNEWHLLTYVLNNGTMSVYLDDNTTAISTGAVNANFSDVNGGVFKDSSLLLGASGLSTIPGFNGSMGDFTIYNYAVGTSEIAETYNKLADEYTYITKVTLNDSQEILASETPLESYIDERKQEGDSTIWFTLPENANLTSMKLGLEYDSSATAQISLDGGATWKNYSDTTAYDLSGSVVLKIKSIDDTSSYVKTYNVKVNGIVEKDWETGAINEILPQGSEFTKTKDDTNLYVGWYTAQGSNTPVSKPATGDVVYNRTITISDPIKSAQSVREANAAEGITKGIRFKAEINRDDFYNYLYADADYVYANATNFKFGMLMLPADMLGENELTIDTKSVLNIKGEKVYDYGTSGGTMAFTGILVNLTDSFCDVDLVARAYVQYTYEGNTYTIYSEQWDAVSYNDVLAKTPASINE